MFKNYYYELSLSHRLTYLIGAWHYVSMFHINLPDITALPYNYSRYNYLL